MISNRTKTPCPNLSIEITSSQYSHGLTANGCSVTCEMKLSEFWTGVYITQLIMIGVNDVMGSGK